MQQKISREIKQHIIHCSDSTHGDVDKIRKWHTDPSPRGNGWSDIGYHFVIKRDGELQIGRPLNIMGAHVSGHNRFSIGTCLVGKKTFTEVQFTTLRILQIMLKAVYPNMETRPHNFFDKGKTCPNFDIEEVLKDLI